VANVRVGTSGWSYPSGKGTWNGIFYPPRRGRAKTFDELTYYSEHFDTVEVNSTFYGQPRREVTQAWAERTPPGFEFAIKLYQKFTHPRMFAERLARTLPLDGNLTFDSDETGDSGAASAARPGNTRGRASRRSGGTGKPERLRRPAEVDALAAIAEPNAADLDEFRRGIEPLASAGKLGPLLAQFPASFKNSEHSRDYLARLFRDLADYRVALELRHRSWSDAFGETLELLNTFGAAWVQIDEPKFRFSIRQNYLPNVSGFY